MAIYNERIKKMRLEKGLTLKDIAKKLNITEATAQRYESGKGIKAVPYEKVLEYAEVLGCTPAYLMGWEDDKKESDNENVPQEVVLSNSKLMLSGISSMFEDERQTKLATTFKKLNDENKDKVISYAEFTYSQQKDTIVKHAKPYVNKKKIKSGLGEITDQLGDRADAVTITAKDFGEGLKAFLNTPIGPKSSKKVVLKKKSANDMTG